MGNCVTTTNGGRARNGSSSRFLREENLHLVPGRFFSNRISSSSSSSSSIYSKQGLKGINQDAMILWEDFGGEGGVLCGVFDGHGPHGHLVARKVRDVLPIRLLSFLPDALGAETVGASDSCCAVNIKGPSAVNMRQALLRSYKAMDRHLRSHPTLDCFCSGTTAVVLLKIGSDLFLGNIGDSRAVLGSKDDAGGDSLVAVQLTVDLKPDLPREAERIQRCRGRVFALQDEPEVQRVWLPFDDAPGLAMARAFGDFCLKDYGVISVPEFSHCTLTDMDRFVVLASDGVWDVLSNKEVVDIVSSSPTRSSAAQFLVDTATHEWKLKYPTSRMDDCSAVCLFFDEETSPGSVSAENNCTAAYRNDVCFSNGSPNEEEPNPEPMLDRNSTVRCSRATCMDGERGADNMAEDQNTIRVDSFVKLPRFSDDGVAD